MSTQKAITQHGEVEYETVKCDSCGNEVVEGEELSYVIGEIRSSSYWSHKKSYEINFHEEGLNRGNLCPHCAEARNLHIKDHSNSKYYNSANTVGSIIKGVRNAHSKYVENMVTHLNADDTMGPYGEPDLITGVIMFGIYVSIIIFILLFVVAVIL
jgi:hypothetical protein